MPRKLSSSRSGFSRRRFLGAAAVSTAALALSRTRIYGANEAINMGFIGIGGRGAASVKWFDDLSKPASTEKPAGGDGGGKNTPENVRIAGLCDADGKILGNVHKRYSQAKAEIDMRRLLDDKSINAVVVSTCNHWHALAAVWAIQAGKDVYVEKPVSNNVWEGRKIVEAARKYNRIVQGGTQQRSDPVQKQLQALIKSGEMGKMLWIRGNRLGMRATIGKRDQPLKPPADVNYDLWLGPAQDEPIFREKFHYDWHWDWNTGSGEMGNWGVHILDDIRGALGDQVTQPKGILSAGGRVAWNDAGETPNVHTVYFDTGVVPVIFSLSNLPLNNKDRKTQSSVWRGQPQSGYVIAFENGYYSGTRGGGKVLDKDWKVTKQFKGDGGGQHARNFIEACKSRDPKHLNAEIERCHYSSSWCHLANVAFQLGQNYTREQHEAASKLPAWTELVDGFHKHLDANEVDVAKAGMKVSGMLEFDPEKEVFIGPSATPEAQALLRREYRKPYVMPEQV